MGESVTPPVICPTLVGRAGHLATLHLLVEHAERGEGHVALISGEAGIGKSRLVAEAKTYATTQGFLLLQGNCFPTDLTYPYAPLLDLLRSLLASNPAATLAAAVETLARDIFPLLPELAPDQPIPLPVLEPEQEKRRLFAVMATFFIHLSRHSPMLLIIEDVHWSDDTSLDFLHYLTQRSVSQPLLLLVTYRHDETHPPLSSWLAQLNRERTVREGGISHMMQTAQQQARPVLVGTSLPRQDGPDKVIGRAHYAGDQALPGMLYAHLVTSPYAHARISNIDTSGYYKRRLR